MIKSIGAFGGTAAGYKPSYCAVASEIGAFLGRNGIELVFGGGSTGIMGAIARSVLDHQGRVTGIIPKDMSDREDTLHDVSELIVAANMHDRKMQMYNLSEAFLALPGGMGTIDEAVEVLCWLNLGLHHKPVVLFNFHNYWDPLISLIKQGVLQGFISHILLKSIRVASSVGEVLDAFGILYREDDTAAYDFDIGDEMKSMCQYLSPIDCSIKLQELAGVNGFDWVDVNAALSKVREETEELVEELLIDGIKERIVEEYGDLLFAMVNLSRHLDINYEDALSAANAKFVSRFTKMEEMIKARKIKIKDLQLNELLDLWKRVKSQGLIPAISNK